MDTILNTFASFDQINDLIGHLIWPIIVILFLFLFKKQIIELFSSIKKLKFREMEAEFNRREKEFAEQDISPLTDEVEGLIKRIEKLELDNKNNQESRSMNDSAESSDLINKRIITGLIDSPYKWRSLYKLASIAGTTEDYVLDFLRKEPKVILSTAKSGKRIARLK